LFEELRKKVEARIKNGQKKMSKIEKPKKVLKKALKVECSYHNAHKTKKITKKSVMINFYENNIKIFS
jgi:hypothetical protein